MIHVMYELVMPYMNELCHRWMSRVTYAWDMSHTIETYQMRKRHIWTVNSRHGEWLFFSRKGCRCINRLVRELVHRGQRMRVEDRSLLANTGSVVICSACSSTIEFDLWKCSMSNWVSRPSWGDRRGWSPKEKRNKTNIILGTQSKARAGWPKRLRLVQATPWADFAVITAQLWSTMTAIFSCVNNFAVNCYLRTSL